jgi:uncharacterized membrane protein
MNVITEILEVLKDNIVPLMVEAAELMGVFIVIVSLLKSLYHYILSAFCHKQYKYLFELGNGLSSALEFMMAAEILKTITSTTKESLLMVAAVFALRALMSLLLHYELHGQEEHPGKLDRGENASKHDAH